MSTRRRTSTDGRRSAALVQKQFPLGTVAGGTVLTLALGGVLTYAFLNQGEGYRDPVQVADEAVPGVEVVDTQGIDTAHVQTAVDYGTDQPPVAGQMAGATAACGTAYPTQPPTEQVMHSLEHGAVWITYRPDLPKDEIAELADRARGSVIVSPFAGLAAPVSAQAWARRLPLKGVDDPRLDAFVDSYERGAQAPEGGMGC